MSATLRRRLARFRRPQTVTEIPMTTNLAASLPLQLTGLATPAAANEPPAFDPPADPFKQVQCTFCGAIGLAADMPDHGRGHRCYPDTDGCGRRWAAGRPVSLLPHEAEPLEPLPVLPPAQEEALQRFNEATDAQDAAEAGEDLSEDGESGPAAAEDATPDEGDAE